MTNAFEILGLEPRLVVSEEVLREAFREVGKRMHPDAGGGDGEFSALRDALAKLSSPSRRLVHWAELRGIVTESRGSIDSGMMDLFTGIGKATQIAEEVIRKREAAKSALARAMMEGETLECRESIERSISAVDAAISNECSIFSEWETASSPDPAEISKVSRNLSFLEKWRAGLRSAYSRLI